MKTLWIARDKDGDLVLYTRKPKKCNGYFISGDYCHRMKIGSWPHMPSVTLESSPQQVELTLVDDHIDDILTVFKALNCRRSFLENHPNISRWDKEYKECSELLEKVKQIIENLK